MRTCFFFLILSIISWEVRGEYFGRNKVQYDNFEFKVLNTPQFQILYYPEEGLAVTDAAKMLERWHGRLKLVFNRSLAKDQPVILYANHADFQQTNAIGQIIPQGTGGVTEGLMNRVILPLTGIYSENDHVLGHELSHAFHYTILKESETGISGGQQIPLWFIEGMAEYVSLGSYAPHTSMWMRDAVLFEDIPSIAQVGSNPNYFPYRYGHAIWAFIAGTYGDQVINNWFHSALKRGWFRSFKNVFGVSIDSISNEWRRAISETYGPIVKQRDAPGKVGTKVIEDGEINLSPSISPDGKYIAFLSARALFTIDLFLADVKTGEILSKLVSSESDEHFDALRFMNSSGAWSPDGQSFAFPVYKKGDNAIAILDVESRKIRETLKISGVDEITHLAWSPDGRQLVLSGTSGAISNLYLYDFRGNTHRQLTNDRYAQIQPSWSPDGKSIIFATDRGGYTNLDSLLFSPMKIGLLRLDTDQLSLISVAPWAKHINPHFSVDGSSIYFIADPDGISDLYRYSLTDGQFFRVTRIATGISGLTELSPAMSIAAKSGRITFSVYEKKTYKIHTFEPSQAHGKPFTADSLQYLKNIKLPPSNSQNPIIDKYLGKAFDELIRGNHFSIDNYQPKLRLLYVGQIFAGIAADPTGFGVGGGISFLFSDLLGNHLMGLGAQINGSIRDFGAEGIYLNMQKRFNWGLNMARTPYVSTRTTIERDTATVNGDLREVQKVTFIDQRIYDNQISFITEYPFSQNRRLELTGGYTRISYDFQAEEIRALEGRILSRNTSLLNEPSSLNLFNTSVAYVGDFSYFGFTSPVTGRRYRFEVEPTTGSLQFLSVLADYRQYFLLNPLTLAFRFFHYGRYLRDSESDRLSQLFLGYDTWVRGYSAYTFDLANCSETNGFENCPEFQRLLGSRVGLFSTELRFPFIGSEQFGLINFPYLPIDLVAFLDGGVAWTRDESAVAELVSRSAERIPVFSAGGAARFNILNLLVFQIYYAYPFQRSDKKWHWGFFFAPGW